METTEKVVEAYVRYVKGWATIPNIKCKGQLEIDLLAVDPVNLERYHIESGVSISGAYSKLTTKPFSSEDLKQRVKAAGQRRTLGYFVERKFGNPSVLETLAKFGFRNGNYTKVIVSWGWEQGVAEEARRHSIVLWDFRDLMREIAQTVIGERPYHDDDTMRTLHLFSMAMTQDGSGKAR